MAVFQKDASPRCVGVVVEYNPFHNGHLHHLEEARKRTGASHVVAVMSGDFVQRGEPALYDKHVRARMALEAGVDLVLELPALFATSSAEDFAGCAVRMLDGLGVVDSLCFGSECGEIGPLAAAAQVLAAEPDEYAALLRRLLREGLSFPQARSRALRECLDEPMGKRAGDGACGRDAAPGDGLLETPNNILGVEYIKAILRQGSRIRPVTLARRGNGYHDLELAGETASASAIRRALQIEGKGEAGRRALETHVPGWVLREIKKGHPVWPDDFSSMLNYCLLALNERGAALDGYLDWSRELADRMERQILDPAPFTARCQSLKTRQYTYTRVSRCLLHLMLGLTREEARRHRDAGYCGYARVLGFRMESASLLGEIKRLGSLTLLSKTADAGQILREEDLRLFQKDLFASHLYQAAVASRYRIRTPNEFTRSPIIV